MKRKLPTQLIKEAASKGRDTWYDLLSSEDREYVHMVVKEIKKNPNAALTLIAEGLIAELSIERGVGVVVRVLKELIRDGKE